MTIRTDEGKTVTLPGWYVAGRGYERPWVDHGYAITGHKTQGLTGDDFGVRPSTRADAQWAYVAASRHRFEVRLYLVEELKRGDEDARHVRDPLEDRVAATLRAMRRSGEQVFAIDQELTAEVRQLTVPELRRERDRLAGLLAGGPPSVAQRISLAEERHRQAEERLARVEQAAQATPGGWVAEHGGCSAPPAGPPATGSPCPWLRRWRGWPTRPPASWLTCAANSSSAPRSWSASSLLRSATPPWSASSAGTAARPPARWSWSGPPGWWSCSASHRRPAAASGHGGRPPPGCSTTATPTPNADLDRALEPEPTRDLAQRRAWRACRQVIDRYHRQHHPRDQRHQRDQRGHRDRDWTRTRVQGREREAG